MLPWVHRVAELNKKKQHQVVILAKFEVAGDWGLLISERED